MHQSHASSISSQVLNVTQAPQRRPPRSHSPGGGRQVAHHPEPGRTKQASRATTLWRPATESICLSCISMLCASHMSTTTRSRSPAAHRLMEVVVVNIDSTVSPHLFFSPSSRHHITVTPSPHPPSPPPSSPPLGSSDPSSLFFFPCSMKVETALHEFPVHPAASRGRCHRLYLSPLSRAAAPAEKDFDADEERTDVLTLSGLVRPQRPAVETGTRTKES